MTQLQQKMLMSGTDVEDDKNPYKIKVNKCVQIYERLGKSSEKKNIMTECKELFYDGTFLEKLDNNPYLMCFTNGVVDFKQKVFRNGVPEDCLSKCTNIDYVHINPAIHADIINEIEDFMKKLFPHPDLYKYMWSHLSSTLIGTSADQTFNMYIGIGQNGKSVLVNLMEKCLGDYKGDVPLSLLTQQRTKIGGLAPELVQLKGVRYAVMQEPSKGDKINEGIMKQVTGGDPLQARSPYMLQTISFIPQFKLVVCSNEFMEIKSMDHGTWRRIRVVDFESLFTDKPVNDDADKPYQYKLDKNIKEKFNLWKHIFMSMMVEIAFKTDGMVEDCDKVMSSSNSYRERQDYFAEFINDRIIVNPTGCVIKSVLLSVFKEWYNSNYGFKGNNPKDITGHIDKRFSKNKNGVWVGISIKDEGAGAKRDASNNSLDFVSEFADSDTGAESVDLEEV
jgi:P4 family phage/plasmid primase-like protien